MGYLNSSLVFFHLFYKGKRKGKTIEYFKGPLEQIPIHKDLFNHRNSKYIESLVEKILNIKRDSPDTVTKDLEREIDTYIYSMFNLSQEEISIIDKISLVELEKSQ